MPRFSFQIDFDHPSRDRTLYFPRRPGRGARDDAVTDYTGVEGWHPLEKNSRHSLRWRGWVGTFIAEHLGYDITKGAWHVDDWPQGYRLWLKERRKPSRTNRADVYLLGFGGRARFESPQEFSFHAVWLYVDEYHDTCPCECTLDTGRGQSEINAIWLQPGGPRVYTRTGSRSARGGGGTSGGGGGGRGSRNRGADIYFEDVEPQSDLFEPGPKLVHWVPSKRSLLDGPPDDSEPSESALPQRGRLRPLLPFKDMELVWVKVPKIDAPNAEDSINLWPALVVDGWSGSHIGEHHYQIRLLGVDTKHTVPETAVFPYQVKPIRRRAATSGPRTLPGNLTSPTQIQQFRPLPASSNPATDEISLPRTYANAVGPYKLASTVAQAIAAQFCLMGQHVGERQDPNAPRLYRWAWMGPQRIEPGDLVRLAPTREKLTELGFPTMELLEEGDGAGKACLFVQVVHIKLNEEGEAGFVGHLFELVPGQGQVESPGPVPLPLPPQAHKFRLISDSTSPGFFNFFWVAGRYEHLTSNSDSHRNFLENNFLGKHPLSHWDVQYRRDKELPTHVKNILSMIGLGPGKWNAITSRAVTVTGRQSGIQHAVKEARRLYFGDEEEIWVSSSSEATSEGLGLSPLSVANHQSSIGLRFTEFLTNPTDLQTTNVSPEHLPLLSTMFR